ncbi:MAG TPA: hypothetical protein VNW52_04240, partial [Burkholderiaceae bacterium]|nr:hypothetical protein [Burkholderiaceae bacterium]
VVAPQVRTMFGLHTSFSESASLIREAIKADPQRFIDLQKIDQINQAVALLAAELDAMIQTQKPGQAVDAAKALAAKFGVKNVDPVCFKDNGVNSRCVAINIVSSADMTVPSEDIWSAGGPNSSAAKVPTDLLASLKIVTEASTYLVNKYGDNYDFAPSWGQRQGRADTIQLVTNARFKSGDVKTAYVYVPSWFAGKQPELQIAAKTPGCLEKGSLLANVKGTLPLANYWHDWQLTLHEPGSATVAAQLDKLDFKPGDAMFSFDPKQVGDDMQMNGQVLDASLTGKFGFASVTLPHFKIAVSASEFSLDRVSGLDSLIAGEHAKLHLTGADGNACIEQMVVTANDKTLATSSADLHGEVSIDLSHAEPGAATLEVEQYGVGKQVLPIVVQKRKAHIERLVHFDLETEITADGDNLDRIEAIQAGHVICRPVTAASDAPMQTSRVFSCSAEIAANANFPAQVSVRHLDQEPASFNFPVTKIAARPHMTVEGVGQAIITTLSPTALQWNLNVQDPLVTEDSGLGVLLHAFGGYRLSHGPYVLQLKFQDDPQTEQKPISVALLSDLTHNELRTRNPISFVDAPLPSIVNPIWYRVQHQPSGLVGDWQPLNRSVVIFPQLSSITCGANGSGLLIYGKQLDLIDWASNDMARKSANKQKSSGTEAVLTRCDQGLCLGIDALSDNAKLKIKMHWIDDRLFNVSFANVPECVAVKAASK